MSAYAENKAMDEEFMARLAAEHEARAAKAMELMGGDPKLPYVSAIIMAGDLMEAERSLQWLRDGTASVARAKAFVGSYGRLDFIVRALDEGLITLSQAIEDLPNEWSSADPDDTDPRFLSLWRRARKVRGQRSYLRDSGKTLPMGRTVTVYRGQDKDAPFGIAWSLDAIVAKKFADGMATRQHGRGGVVYVGHVLRTKVLGYMTGRNEEEVVLDPDDLMDVEVWR